MAETPDKEPQGDKPPETVQLKSPGRVTATVVSLAALAILGAATANLLPNLDRFALPNADRLALPKFDRIALPKFDFSWPDFIRTAEPKSNRIAPPSPPRTVSVPIPDPLVRTMLIDIQSSQQQDAAVLASLTQSAENQQSDLRRISRQLHALTVQVNALQGAVGPLTTSSITPSKARTRFVRRSPKTIPPPLPKPVGPVSVGGAPLSTAPASGSGV
ncbi:hypothetical protein [Bradyrhizobium sp.]|uniref:hypothetical protein n=1 Tax=Bradyrhizobium sp. TaxID=376 RepID=UPI001D651486|nr:hypothetical protein [Bradyrhizobium sp.]MBI5323237.1 hypothetical protein [Bradyrhizobium sp.]